MKAYQTTKLAKEVFRAYDIRGIIHSSFDENAFYTIGKAIACALFLNHRQRIFLGRDGRLTSESLARALKQGLLDSGATVIDLGQIATPMMYFATHVGGDDSGLIVTGSHNPKEYNGLKIVLAGKTLMKQEIQELYSIIEKGQFHDGQGHAEVRDIVPQYLDRIGADIRLKRSLKVVVDSGNGVIGPTACSLLKKIGCEVVPLFCEIDGNFPNHHPDPTMEKNLVDLKAMVLKEQADLGIAFDGDADRLGVISPQGEVIWADRVMILLAKHVLKTNPRGTIAFDVKCSSLLSQSIEAWGGVPKMCATGHSIVKNVMKESNAVLAGEMSGHLFFKDRWYGFDDALYSACRLLEILAESPLSTTEHLSQIPNRKNTPEIQISMPEHKKFSIMEQLFKTASFEGGKLVNIDGIRIEFPKGWGLIRASNTTPCLVARFEADDEDELLKIQQLFKVQLSRIEPDLEIPFPA